LTMVLLLIVGCNIQKSEGISVIKDHVDFGEQDYEKIVWKSNQLGFHLLNQVKRDENKNTFISPASLYMLLSVIYNGADGQTKEEMADFLGVDSYDDEDINKANASLLHSLYKETKKLSLQIGNSLWLRDQLNFDEEFTKRAVDYFNGEIKSVDMSKEETVQEINTWVRKATEGKIEEIIEGPLDSQLVTVLINAIYFKGDWKYAFDESQTMDGFFMGEQGERNDATFMKLDRRLSYLETEDFQSVSLPYGNGEMSMKIFLPKEGKSLDSVIKELNVRNWKKWSRKYVAKKGTLLFPKFTLEYETTLHETLIDLGLGSPFNPSTADFSRLIQGDQDMYIDLIKQKTYIDIHEKGTEAAAVTSAQIRLTSAPMDSPFYMMVNRPFFFTINDEETEAILFMGAMHLPESE